MSGANKTNNLAQEHRLSQEAEKPSYGIASELWYFLRHNKKWWLTPIILVLVMVGLLIAIGGTAAAPFIYTLF